MQQLNQIILCSQARGRSYLRELAVFDAFAVVTNIERLPFRYHELIGKKRAKDELVVTLDVPIRRTANHRACPFCGQGTIFQCSHCGFLSCKEIGTNEHHCPGCDRTYRTKSMKESHASESGFVDTALVDRSSDNRWTDAQSTLLGLINHRNRQENP